MKIKFLSFKITLCVLIVLSVNVQAQQTQLQSRKDLSRSSFQKTVIPNGAVFAGKEITQSLADEIAGRSGVTFADCSFILNEVGEIRLVKVFGKYTRPEKRVIDCISLQYKKGDFDVFEMVSSVACGRLASRYCRGGYRVFSRGRTKVVKETFDEGSNSASLELATTLRSRRASDVLNTKLVEVTVENGQFTTPKNSQGLWSDISYQKTTIEVNSREVTISFGRVLEPRGDYISKPVTITKPILTARLPGRSYCPAASHLVGAFVGGYFLVEAGGAYVVVSTVSGVPLVNLPQVATGLFTLGLGVTQIVGDFAYNICKYITDTPPPKRRPRLPIGTIPPLQGDDQLQLGQQCLTCDYFFEVYEEGTSVNNLETDEIDIFSGRKSLVCAAWRTEPNGVDNTGDGYCDQ